MNKYACLDKYFMPLLKKIFDTLGETKVLNLHFKFAF